MIKVPFFSIITCTYNSERFIKQNIKSVENQTYHNYEQIFIDGESKDSTQTIINKFAKEDTEKYKLFIYPAKGISNAFNKGINKSKGEYLIFLNSDDYFYDERVLEDVKAFLSENKNCDWIYGKINVVEADGKTVGVFPKWKIFQIANRTLLKFVNFVPHQAVFMKRKVFADFGFFAEDLKTSMDRDLWLRVANKTNWRFFDRIITNYTIWSESATSTKKKWKENSIRVRIVQKKYLTGSEMVLARIVNKYISLISKVHR